MISLSSLDPLHGVCVTYASSVLQIQGLRIRDYDSGSSHTKTVLQYEFILGSTSQKQGVVIPIFMYPLACALACE